MPKIETTTKEPQTKAGFIAIIGAPNAGKSTLLNAILEHRLAIVSPKVQTTRTNIRGVLTTEETQFVFVDTPGIHKTRRNFDQAMVDAAWQALGDADVVLFVVDALKGFSADVKKLINTLQVEEKRPTILLALNKIDRIDKKKLLPLMAEAAGFSIFEEIFPISALKTKPKEREGLLSTLAKKLPYGPFLYDEDTLTDMPSRLWAAEATRERAFLLLGQELPYALSVETLQFEKSPDGAIRIEQYLYVQRDGQKKILVGKNGQMLKEIGTQARKAMESMFQTSVHLFLRVKVQPNWASDIYHLKMLGLSPTKNTPTEKG